MSKVVHLCFEGHGRLWHIEDTCPLCASLNLVAVLKDELGTVTYALQTAREQIASHA